MLTFRALSDTNPTDGMILAWDNWTAKPRESIQLIQDRLALDKGAFVSVNGTTFTVMAMGLERYRASLQQTVSSFRQLTQQERNSIGGLRVRVADLRSGETLSSFGHRVDNSWSPELTGIINGVDAGKPPKTGMRLKLARQERYTPE